MNPYIKIARIDHWFKNVFMLPGVVVALLAVPGLWQPELIWKLLFAFFTKIGRAHV